jgi:DNA polymerase
MPALAAARDPDAPHLLFHDLETRSQVDLKSVGAFRYAADRSTEVLCIAYAVDNELTQIWTPNDSLPSEFIEAARNPNWVAVAHNASFERAIARYILGPRHGFPEIPLEQWCCTMAAGNAAALPAALEKVAEVLELPHTKDKAGAALMRRMAKPLPGGGWIEDVASLEKLYSYCRQDVEIERDLFRVLPLLTDDEQAVWQLDATINERGFYTDGELLVQAHRVVTAAEAKLQAEFRSITGLKSTNQLDKFLAWLCKRGCEMKDLRKATVSQALRRKNLEPEIRRAIEIRRELAHASAAKIKTLRAWRGEDGRVRGGFRFHGAGTGRWTSHGVQVQNFKRDSEGVGAKISAIMAGGDGLESPVEVVGDIARALICAAPGHRLLIADFSGVESRILAWISGQQSKINAWAKFDHGGADPYHLLGRRCGLPEQSARAVGKTIDLSFGFGGGPGAWAKAAPEDDETDEATVKRYQQTWRAEHPETVKFWRGLDRAAISAVRNPGRDFPVGRVAFRYGEPFLRLRLPSGRSISYPYAEIAGVDKFGFPRLTFLDNASGRLEPCRHGNGSWFGLLAENVVQGCARDLLAAAMLRLEAGGFASVLHCHDEIVVETLEGFGSIEEFCSIVEEVPPWAQGMPIRAKARAAHRFAKEDAAPRASSSIPPQDDATVDSEVDESDRNSSTISTGGVAEDPGEAAAPWSTPSVGEVPPGPELEEIIARLPPEDREFVRPDQANEGEAPQEDAPPPPPPEEEKPQGSNGSAGSRDNGRAYGGSGLVHCPFHDDSTPSLQIFTDEGDEHYHCHGCQAHGPLSDLSEELIEAAVSHGQRRPADDGRTLEYASRLWEQSGPIVDTLAERYLLEVRGINVNRLPADLFERALRFHPACPLAGGNKAPCLIALFRDIENDAPAGIHRIVLAPGVFTGAKVERQMLGRWQRPRAFKLWPAGKRLYLGEGIETVLAAATWLKLEGTLLQPAWAAGSSGNLAKFPLLAGVEELVLLVDRDHEGEDAAAECSRSWKAAGRRVRRLRPQDPALSDFNDLLCIKLRATQNG